MDLVSELESGPLNYFMDNLEIRTDVDLSKRCTVFRCVADVTRQFTVVATAFKSLGYVPSIVPVMQITVGPWLLQETSMLSFHGIVDAAVRRYRLTEKLNKMDDSVFMIVPMRWFAITGLRKGVFKHMTYRL
jgi:hypothetical protein